MKKLTCLLLMSMLLFAGCDSGPISNTNTDDFTVSSAQVQSWETGYKGGLGKTYIIELSLEKDAILEFDSLWMGEFAMKADVMLKGGGTIKWKKGEILQVMIIEYMKDGKLSSGTKNAINPVGYEGAALIRYFKSKEPHYFMVREFQAIK